MEYAQENRGILILPERWEERANLDEYMSYHSSQ